jgi:hypothetical protein
MKSAAASIWRWGSIQLFDRQVSKTDLIALFPVFPCMDLQAEVAFSRDSHSCLDRMLKISN